jgi:hypothetical protein
MLRILLKEVKNHLRVHRVLKNFVLRLKGYVFICGLDFVAGLVQRIGLFLQKEKFFLHRRSGF